MKHKESKEYFSLLTKIGGSMIACILIFFFIGYKLDQFLHTKGLLTVGFMFLGLVVGFYLMYLTLKTFFDEKQEK